MFNNSQIPSAMPCLSIVELLSNIVKIQTVLFVGLYFPFPGILQRNFLLFWQFSIQIVIMENCKCKLYQSLHSNQVLEVIMCDSDL